MDMHVALIILLGLGLRLANVLISPKSQLFVTPHSYMFNSIMMEICSDVVDFQIAKLNEFVLVVHRIRKAGRGA
jgi:hypothetical protein